MSEVSTTRFLNRDGEVNSLVLDPSNNTALIKDDSGDIIVNYTNGTWAPTNKAPVDILKDSKKGGIFDRAFKSSYDNLSEVDQNKLSIYASEKNIENETVAQSDETTITDGQDENQSMDVGKPQTYDERNVFKNLRYPESQKETDNFDPVTLSFANFVLVTLPSDGVLILTESPCIKPQKEAPSGGAVVKVRVLAATV